MKRSFSVAMSPLQHMTLLGGAAALAISGSACGGSTADSGGDAGHKPILSQMGDTGATGDGNTGVAPDTGTGDGGGGTGDANGSGDGPGTTKPDAPVESKAMVALPLSACVPSEYNAALQIGTQTFQLSVDTGSTSLGVASTQCPSCNVSPAYAPGPSATDQHQTATSQFGSGAWSGEIYTDTVAIPSKDSAVVEFVSITQQNQFFEPIQCSGGEIQGIVGFGPAAAALPGTNAFFDQLVAATGMPNVFATELCPSSGWLWLGGYDATFTTAAPQYVPLTSDQISSYYYSVALSSITVSGVTVPVPSGEFADSVVDTGTSIFILGVDAYNGVTTALSNDPGFQQIFGTPDSGLSFLQNPQGCVQLGQTKAQLDAILPPLTLNFGSVAVQAAATESYLVDYDGEWCSSLDSITPSVNGFPFASIMGSPVLRSNIVIWDRANARIGFAPHTACN